MAVQFTVFVSSTFDDFVVERDVLRTLVYPALARHCEARGAQFEAVDLRWGVSRQAVEARQAVQICLAEVDRCVASGMRPDFLVLLGDRLGWRGLPSVLDAELHASLVGGLRATGAEAQADSLEALYPRVDDNAVPRCRVLTVSTDEHRAREVEVLDALERVVPRTDVLDALLGSVTEQEVRHRLACAPVQESSLVAVRRELVPAPAGRWIDQDDAARPRRERLRADLRRTGQVVPYTVRGDPGTEGDDVRAMASELLGRLTRLVDDELDRAESVPRASTERAEHLAFAAARGADLVGRDRERAELDAWLAGPGGGALVVHGPSGSGKSSLLAACVLRAAAGPVPVVARFVGVTEDSSEPARLTASLLDALREVRPGAGDPGGSVELQLADALATWPADDPVLVVVDALDQLGVAPLSPWLAAERSAGVHLLVSVLDGTELDVLSEVVPGGRRLALAPLAAVDRGEALEGWLAAAGRSLTREQRTAVLDAAASTGLPLHLRLLFERARRWPSWADGGPLATDAAGAVGQLLDDLMRPEAHGEVLVGAALAALVASRAGLSGREVVEILSADARVLADQVERAPSSPRIDGLAPVVWARLRHDLGGYLVDRATPGAVTLVPFHREVREAIERRWVTGPAGRAVHGAIADHFLRQPAWIVDRDGRTGPHLRRATELMSQLLAAGRGPDARAVVTDAGWLSAVAHGLGGWELAAQVHAVATGLGDDPELVELDRAARAAAPHVEARPGELPAQLVARLAPSELRDRLTAADWPHPWLESRSSSLRGTSRADLDGHSGTARSIAVSHDGAWCASFGASSPDRTVRFWSVETGRNVRTVQLPPGGGAVPMAFRPSGRLLLGLGAEIVEVDRLSGRSQPRAVLPEGAVIAAMASASDVDLAVAVDHDGRAWILTDAGCTSIDGPPADDAGRVTAAALSDDGTVLAVLTTGLVRLLDLRDGTWRTTPRAGDVPWEREPLGVSHDGRVVLFGAELQRWDVSGGDPEAVLAGSAIEFDVRAVLALTPDGRHALVSPRLDELRDAVIASTEVRMLAAWDVGAPALGADLPEPGARVAACALTPDGASAIVAYDDHSVRVWDLRAADQGQRAAPARRLDNPIARLVVDPPVVHARDQGRQVATVDLRTGEMLESAPAQEVFDRGTPAGPRRRRRTVRAERRRRVSAAVWVGSDSGTVGVRYDLLIAKASDQPDGPDDPHAPPTAPFAVYRRLLGRWVRVRRPRVDAIRARLVDVALDADGRRAVVASNGSLRVFDLRSGRQLFRLVGHQGVVRTVAVVPGVAEWPAGLVVSGGEDATVRVWDLRDGHEVASLRLGAIVTVVAACVEGTTAVVVAGDAAGHVDVLSLRAG
ncbi:AAA family ATPase [Cellulomonas sp. ICMP 17802]|uniref:AAA family ATPase n=1 Tax=Cellulomonas sp. ICMP 17802 TaxID=3239199 RepID=UPI00351B4F89